MEYSSDEKQCFRAARECVICFLNEVRGKALECSILSLATRKALCVQLGIDFVRDRYPIRHKTIKMGSLLHKQSAAAVLAQTGGLCVPSSIYWFLTGAKSSKFHDQLLNL